MLDEYYCGGCNMDVLGVFFYYDEIRYAKIERRLHQVPSQMRCLGCTLISILEGERDHYKCEKRQLVCDWLWDGPESNTNDLQKALSDFIVKDVLRKARLLEVTRKHDTRCLKYDREYQEVQYGAGGRELTRLGRKYLSPSMETKKRFYRLQNMSPEERQWAIHPDENYRTWGHGHGGLD